MNESMDVLLERMHVSRGTLAKQLQQIRRPEASASAPGQRRSITPTQICIGLGVAVALRRLFPPRRRRPGIRS
jgi:hypothetical protein